MQIRLNDPCEAATDHLFIIENLIIVWSAEARNIWNSHPPALQIRTSLTPSVVNLRVSISNRASNLLSAFYSAPQIRLLLTIVCVIYLLQPIQKPASILFTGSSHRNQGDTWTKLVPRGNTEARNGYYVMNDVTVRWRSFCLHTFGIFSKIKCPWFSRNACIFKFQYTVEWALPPPHTSPPSFFKIKFYFINIKFYYANQCVPRHKNKH